MPITIHIRADHLHAHWSGTITPADLGQLLGELPATAARCQFTPQVLHTVDDDAALALGPLEAFNYSNRRTRTLIPVTIHAAFVAHTPVAVALANTFRNINQNPRLVIRAFAHETDALAWLRKPGGRPPAH